jgi:hypothetical protein
MSQAKVILVAAPELIPALRERVADDGQVLTFADSDPVRAMEAISAERPRVIALERLFAASPRGAALIARIKEDPGLDESEIRILSHDSTYQRVSPRRHHAPSARTVVRPVPVLDRGTRRAPRFRLKEAAEATVGGQPARLADLSVVGVQLVGPESLRPKQDTAVTLGPTGHEVVVAGTVIWARVELSRRGPAARVGIDFTDPDTAAIEAFLEANRQR